MLFLLATICVYDPNELNACGQQSPELMALLLAGGLIAVVGLLFLIIRRARKGSEAPIDSSE